MVALVEGAESPKAQLQEGLDHLSQRLGMVVVVGAAVLVGMGLLCGRDPSEVVEIAVALAIAVVPEGLQAVATLALAVGIGAYGPGPYAPRSPHRSSSLRPSAGAADQDEDGDPIGDPTETALLLAAKRAGVDWRRCRAELAREREVPFDPETKRMAVVAGGNVHVKGAPELLLHPDQDFLLVEASQRMAGPGLRTLALARRPAPDEDAPDEEVFTDLDAVGAVGLQDRPRDSVVAALDALRRAGIRTVMITGDRADTAATIASEMDLAATEDSAETEPGTRLTEVSEDDFRDIGRSGDVFAQVEPEHKVRIIEAFQADGHVVAVAGDGVNDAPALSRADVGVANGSGTDVAKDDADVVLLDDEFSSIEVAVEEGRRIFTSIRRYAQHLFSWHVAEVTVIAVALLAGLPPPWPA